MNKLLSLILAVALIAGTIGTAAAQEDVLRPRGRKAGEFTKLHKGKKKPGITLGVEGGLNYNMYSADLSWLPSIENSSNKVFESANGISGYFAVFADFPISNNFGIQAKIAWDGKAIDNSYTGVTEYEIVGTGTYSVGREKADIESSGSYFGFSALARFNILPELFVLVGPVYQVPNGKFETQLTKKSVDKEFIYQQNNQNSISVKSKSEVNSQFGLEFGTGYKIQISKKIWIVPGITFQYILTKIYDDETIEDADGALYWSTGIYSDMTKENSKLHSLRFTLGLWFDL